MNDEEQWKPVAEYPDRFLISNHGRVWSNVTRRILSQCTTHNGYRRINSRIGGRQGKYIYGVVHRWVAEAFIPNPDCKPYVNHIDGDKTNNHVDNLEWCTAKENTAHANMTGLNNGRARGTRSPDAKLTDADVRAIRKRYVSRCRVNGARAIARDYGTTHETIRRVLNGKSWKHVE